LALSDNVGLARMGRGGMSDSSCSRAGCAATRHLEYGEAE
jgi:hypothetical protein